MKRFNVYARNNKLLDKNVTADYIKDEYERKNPWRYAKHCMLFKNQYRFVEVGE